MQSAMKNDTKELILHRNPKTPGIIANPVHAYGDFGAYGLFGFGKWEGYDVGVKVVLEELAIYLQQALIGAEDIAEVGERFALFSK
jgi:hypothetical protein